MFSRNTYLYYNMGMLFILYLIYIISFYTSTKCTYRCDGPFPSMFSKIKHAVTDISVLNLSGE